MRRPALAVLALTVLALAGCSNEPAEDTAAPTTTRTTTAAPTTTADPLAGYSSRERAFLVAFTTAFDVTGGAEAETMQIGNYVCGDIRAGVRPAETQAALSNNVSSPEDAANVYTLASQNLCPEVPLPDPNSFSSGTYEVGLDIQPGRYRSPGGDGCYWARLDDGQEIIDNNLSDGPTVFDVAESDAFVELNRCTWTLAE